MGKEGEPKAVVCAQEALNLLNCVTQSPYDQDKCLHLLHSLRDCVLAKKLFTFQFEFHISTSNFDIDKFLVLGVKLDGGEINGRLTVSALDLILP
ncbi:hypothetical protein Lal_00026910 [Lupinus albus]|nr:hypothetical protein Lal_00026910 [Lupinus albus]